MDRILVAFISGLEMNPGKARTFVWKCFIVILMDDGGLVNAQQPHRNTAPTCVKKVCLAAFYLCVTHPSGKAKRPRRSAPTPNLSRVFGLLAITK